MPDLSVTVDGLRLRNPFVIASGPPGTNASVIARAYDEGWGAVVCKTVCLDASKIVNVQPRYARLRAKSGEIYGWENIELISDRSFDVWLDEFKRLKDRYPDRPLIASIMEEYRRDAWVEIVERSQEAGVDALELQHVVPAWSAGAEDGLGDGGRPGDSGGGVRLGDAGGAGAGVGEADAERDADCRTGAGGAGAGCQGISAINTLRSVIGVNLDTLRPEPTVEGLQHAGGLFVRGGAAGCAGVVHGCGDGDPR